MGNQIYRLLRHEETPNQIKTCQRLILSKSCYIRDFRSFSGPLNEGIGCLVKISEYLIDYPTALYNHDQLRKYIVQAEQCMGKAEKMIDENLKNLDQHIEHLIRKKQNAEEQKKENSLALQELQIEKNSAENVLQVFNVSLGKARQNVEVALYALRVAKDRMDSNRGLAIAGGILLAIPFMGWIIGSIMLDKGVRELQDASNIYNAVEKDKRNDESKVSEYTEKVLEYKRKVLLTQNEIETISVALRDIEGMITELQKDLKNTADDQQMVRSAVRLLGDLSGRVTVLEKQTQNVILLRPVVNIMKDVVKAVVKMTENHLYCGDLGLINTLKENVGKLQVVCSPPSDHDGHLR